MYEMGLPMQVNIPHLGSPGVMKVILVTLFYFFNLSLPESYQSL